MVREAITNRRGLSPEFIASLPPEFLLDSDAYTTTIDGRRIKASSLHNDRTMISFTHVIGDLIELPKRRYFLSPEIHKLVLNSVVEYNRFNPDDKITPTIVIGGNKKSYLINIKQVGNFSSLLAEILPKIEPLLPFYVKEEEMERLREGDSETKEMVLNRLMNLGIRTLRSPVSADKTKDPKRIEKISF